MGLYSDLDDALAIVRGGNPNIPKARRFIANAIDRAMMRIVDAERLDVEVLRARDCEKSAKRILKSLKPRAASEGEQ